MRNAILGKDLNTGVTVISKRLLNFKHSTTLFVYTNTSFTRKNDKWTKNEHNDNKWRMLGDNKENHNNHNLQKFHKNDKVWIEQILGMNMMHNLLEQICSETVALEFI